MDEFNVFRLSMVREKRLKYDVSAPLHSPERAAQLFRKLFKRDLPCEQFWLVGLDSRNRPLGARMVSSGSLNGTLVHPADVFAPALLLRSAAVLVAHNHPSGDPTPSAEDRALTRRLADAGRVLGIELLDHVVLGEPGYSSFRERGEL